MTYALPTSALETLDWTWEHFAPLYADLAARPIDGETLDGWLRDWTQVSDLFGETYARLSVATTRDTTDTIAETRFMRMLRKIYPQAMAAEQELRQKLLASSLEPAEFAVPLRKMRAEAELFREDNLPLLAETSRLAKEYNKLIGAQTVSWEGEERTLTQLRPLLQSDDRALRERVWQVSATRQLEDRTAINTIWQQLFELRQRIAAQADKPDYRAYSWQAMRRFDYTADDCLRFHDAIEQLVVPAAERVYARRRQQLGVDTLRPWDLEAPLPGVPALTPFTTVQELEERSEAALRKVDATFGDYFATMRREDLLDLDNRKGKAPGGYCATFEVVKRPFIFMNAVGLADDVRTILHEAGHAFHAFEAAQLAYNQQRDVPMEFAEVASMAMELLAAPYLKHSDGGFYGEEAYVRARIEHLEDMLCFWPYMAVVDGFQHWAYTHTQLATDATQCDRAWDALWQRFMRGQDWSGLDDERVTGWHRKLHLYGYPFYYVEYGLAQLGAVQVWRNALHDQPGAVAAYRSALALGGKRGLPDLFAAAGGRFAFDVETVGEAVELLENTIAELGA
ncbi:M3 family oligoendopeptidase [Candidatus Gracilibacteria bacterium]|nr:M3 family oligoendopeptidase [Candidatus Gracilibacteria bacterium]